MKSISHKADKEQMVSRLVMIDGKDRLSITAKTYDVDVTMKTNDGRWLCVRITADGKVTTETI